MDLWRISNYADLSGIGGLLRVALPPDLAIETVGDDMLSADWRTQTIASREIGDQWLDRSSSALLRVPSAISQGHNYLLNPAHVDAARIAVAEVLQAPFDARLLQ